jgi:PKD repeat protein
MELGKSFFQRTYAMMSKAIFTLFISALLSVQASGNNPSPKNQAENDPFPFVENKGQWPKDIYFSSSIVGGKVFLGRNEFRFHLIAPKPHGHHAGHEHEKEKTPGGHVYRMLFLGSNLESARGAGKMGKTKYHYLLDNDPEKWGKNAACWEDVFYQNLYPGIDLKIKGGKDFKYDFCIEPNTPVNQIKLRFEGVKNLKIKNGKLQIPTALGLVEEHIPYAFQIIQGKNIPVGCEFVLKGNDIQFKMGKTYNPKFPLVIDPALIFFSYSGSLSDNWGSTAAADRFGNGYLAGTIYGNRFPYNLGAYDTTFNGNISDPNNTYDIGIQKFNSAGNELIFCTYLGGNEADNPHSINVDNQDNLVIMGTTSSLNFPLSSNAFQNQFAGGISIAPLGFGYEMVNGSDLFVTRISSNGSNLLHSTYLGGSRNDGIMGRSDTLVMNYGDQYRGDLAITSDNGVVVSSYTTSQDFPTQSGFQPNNRGLQDGIVFRLSPDFSQLIWSSYLGGGGNDALFSVHLQGNDRVLVCGGTTSRNFPVTANAIKGQANPPTNSRSGRTDPVVASFNVNTGNLLASTYLGSSQYDQAYLIESDESANVYIVGQTLGSMVRTPGCFGQDAGTVLLQKCNPDLSSVIWQTKIGNTISTGLVPSALLVDSCERIYFSGWGGINNYERSSGFMGGNVLGLPTTVGAIKQTSTTSSEFYFAVLSPDAQNLEYGSFFGGSSRGEHVDGGMSRFDKSGTITQAICGCRSGNNFVPGSQGSYSPSIRSINCNQGLIKLELGILKAFFSIFASTTGCNNTVSFTNQSLNGLQYAWYFGDGDSLVSSASPILHTYALPGTYIVTLYARNPQFCKTTVNAYRDTITIGPQNALPQDTIKIQYCKGDTIQVNLPVIPGVTRRWLNTTYFISPANTQNPVIVPLQPIIYPIRNTSLDGCTTISYVQTLMKSDLILSIEVDSAVDKCASKASLRFTGFSNGAEFYRWNVNGQTFTGPRVNFENPLQGTYKAILYGIKNTCTDSVNRLVIIPPYQFKTESVFTFSQEIESCFTKKVYFKNQSQNTNQYEWDLGNGTTLNEKDPVIQYNKEGKYPVSLIVKNQFCRDTNTQVVEYKPFFVPNLVTLNEDDKNDRLEIPGLEKRTGLSVFNRWGKSVFESAEYQNDWPESEKIENGVYFIYLRFENGNACKQWVMVER